MKPLRLVIFDCDGTLVDSQWTIIGAMGRAFANLNLPRPTDDAVRRVVGLSLHESMARAAETYAIGVSWGYHPVEELHAAGAHAVINRFEDLAGTLTSLLDRP